MLMRFKRPVFSPSIELFLGGDWRATQIFSVNIGVGFDLGPRGPGIVLKSRFEWIGTMTQPRKCHNTVRISGQTSSFVVPIA